MKGFVFTLDAIFSLMIAAIGLTVLFYFTYTAPSPYFLQSSSSGSMLNSFASTKLSSASSVALVNYITWQYAASNQSWPMSMRDQYNNAGNNYGPKALTLNYVFNANMGVINGSIVAGYGNVYFGAGNTVYALNVSTGTAIWTSGAPYNALTSYSPYINATLLYGGMLIYATAANISRSTRTTAHRCGLRTPSTLPEELQSPAARTCR